MINISFFSYKGGAGRTSLLLNTLPFLAEALHATEREPIIVLDLDLDSKGLTYLVNRESEVNSIEVLRGDSVIGFRQVMDIHDHPFFKKLVPIGSFTGLDESLDRSILCVTAHQKEGASFLNESDSNNYDTRNLTLNMLNKVCRNFKCKAIVMDTPAGNQISGECAIGISTKIVTVMRITSQFRRGTEEFLRTKCQGNEVNGKEFIIVPNAVPNPEGTEFKMENIMDSIKTAMTSAVNDNVKINLSLLENGMVGINEVNSFKFRESILKYQQKQRQLNGGTLSDDEKKALEMYRFLAGVLANVYS